MDPQSSEPATTAQPDPQTQPSSYSQQTSSQEGTIGSSSNPAGTMGSPDFVTRQEFDERVSKLEKQRDEALEVTAPQPDPEITAATAAAVGQPNPNVYHEGNNPPEGPVDPHARSDGTGLATEGNEPVPAEKKGFFHGW